MNWHDKRVKYGIIVTVVLFAIIAFQIANKLIVARNKANQASKANAVAVETAFPKKGTINPVIRLTGSLEPIWQADVAAKVAGRLEQVHVDVGTQVAKGQVLAVLESNELSASANSAMGSVYDTRASLAQAETTLERYKKLYSTGAISKQTLDNAQFTRDMAAGKLSAAEGLYANAESKVNGTEVIAPQAGRIIKRYYQEGYYAPVGSALFNIADISSLTLKMNIPEGQIGGVSEGLVCHLEIPSLDNKKVDGIITKLATVADLPARTFAAEVTVDNSNNQLRGGLSANVFLNLAPKNNVLTIPQDAIIMREDQRTVFVVDDQGKVTRRVLDTGYIGGGIVEVLSGITENDRVIISGQNRIREGSKVSFDKGGKN